MIDFIVVFFLLLFFGVIAYKVFGKSSGVKAGDKGKGGGVENKPEDNKISKD
jgi:hypothetical protein